MFFPPTAPLYGAPIIERIGAPGPTINGERIVPPEMLADFVSENIYPALSTLLVEDALSKRLLARIQAYQATRTALVNELSEQIRLAAAADPAAGENTLRAFASQQAPRLAALEQEAEQIRRELVGGGLFQARADWFELRSWNLATLRSNRATTLANAEYQVIRAAAFFADGFSSGQRGLLREIAMAQRDRLQANRPGPPPPGGASDPLAMFFSPETSRLRLPPNLPSELAATIGIYNHDKDEAKAELRDVVVSQDRPDHSTRTRAFTALAERQAPRLAALDARAEDIRRGLAALPKPPPPAYPSGLPPEFLAQLDAYRRDKAALDREHFKRVTQARQLARVGNWGPPTVERIRQQDAATTEALNQAAKDFRQENAERYADLEQRSVKLRASLDAITADRIDPTTGRPMESVSLLRMITATNQEFDKLGREEAIYHDYRIAMLLPGLSPKQRRLLFGAALVGLAQPLPPAEIIDPRFPPMLN